MSNAKTPRSITTFEPEPDVLRMMKSAIRRRSGKGGNTRGLVRKICNEALRQYLSIL